MSESASSHRVAEAPSSDPPALGSRDNWWGDTTDQNTDTDTDDRVDDTHNTNRPDPNNPAEIIAHTILRETATMICATNLRDEPYLDDVEDLTHDERKVAEAFAALDGERYGKYALHTDNEAVEMTDPAIRLGQHAPEKSLVGEYGCERHRKRYNPATGYVSGGETTGVLIQDRPWGELREVIEQWLRGVAARESSGLTTNDVDDALQFAKRLKKNVDHNGLRDVDIMTKVVERV
jgi:hypothetical protein